MSISSGSSRVERFVTVPRSAVSEALARPVTGHLVVDNAGYIMGAHPQPLVRKRGASYMIIAVCTGGAAWLKVGDVTHRVTSGSAFVIPPNVPSAYAALIEPWTIWWCTLMGKAIPEVLPMMGVTSEAPIVPIRNVGRIVALIDEILTSYERDLSTPRLLEATGTAWRLVTRLSADRSTPDIGDPLRRAMEYLEERFDGEIRVPELAALVGVSRSQLTTLFHEATGGGVLAYQVGLRMARARLLLDQTSDRVAGIARQVGYEDPYYFSRHFHRVHGMSPTEFRRRRDVA